MPPRIPPALFVFGSIRLSVVVNWSFHIRALFSFAARKPTPNFNALHGANTHKGPTQFCIEFTEHRLADTCRTLKATISAIPPTLSPASFIRSIHAAISSDAAASQHLTMLFSARSRSSGLSKTNLDCIPWISITCPEKRGSRDARAVFFATAPQQRGRQSLGLTLSLRRGESRHPYFT